MKRVFFSIVFAMLITLFAGNSVRLAAQATPGTPPFSSLTPLPEGNLDLAVLNTQVPITIVSKGGIGIPFDFSLVYNSLVWAPQGGAWQGSGGWYPGTVDAEEVGYAQPQRTVQVLCPGEGSRCITYGTCVYALEYSNWVYVDPRGTPHSVNAGTVADYSACTQKGTYPYTASGYASDGSGWDVTVNAVPEGVSATDLHDRSYDLQAETVTDPNGNRVSCCWTDTLGQAALSYTPGQYPYDSSTYTYTNAAGTAETVTVKPGTYTVRTNFGCSGIQDAGPLTEYLVQEIDLADGTSYEFTYEPTPGYAGDVTGRIASITLPSGGVITYQYSGGSNGITCSDGIPATLTRTTPDGTWTYTHTESGSAWATLVTDPAGNQAYYQFQGQYETERQIYKGAVSASNLLETVTTCYNGAAAPCNATSITLPITERTVIITRDDGIESETMTTFSSFDQPLETDSYADGTSPGAVFRKEIVTYGTDNWPASVQVEDGGGNLQAETTYGYNSAGNLTSLARWVSGSTYDTTNYSVNANGTVANSTDPMGNKTTYSYGTGSCNGAFPTQTSLPNGLSTSATWNCYIAAPATATNTDGQQTTFSYGDPFGRLTEIDAPDGQKAVIAYTDASNTVDRYISTTSNTTPASNSGWRHEQDIYDWAGRLVEHELVNFSSSNSSKTLTTYNSLGEVASVTNPYVSTSDPTYGVTGYTYDALGRVIKVTNPDQTTSTISYGSNVSAAGGLTTSACGDTAYPAMTVSAQGRAAEEWLDADGNVVEADEPNPSTGSMTAGELATCYTYTAQDQLATVSQGGQERALAYDGQGNVLYSLYPEAAADISGPANGFGGTTWSAAMSYNSDGEMATYQDANGVTTSLGYDSLGRLTTETFSDSTPALSFIYDTSSGCTVPNGATITNAAGRLVCAMNANGTETLYSYDTAGRAASVWEEAPGSAWAEQSYAYFYNGQVSSYTNPVGDTFTYTADSPGRITAIQAPSGWNSGEMVLNSAVYSPFGALASADVGPTFIANTFNDDLETTDIQASVGGTTQFDRGYAYDSDGLVTKDNDGMNTAYDRDYSQDYLGRLTQMTVPNTPGGDADYYYDRWGNLYQATGPENWNVGISGSTNRITTSGFAYDSDGRLTSDGSAGYSWNALGEMTGYNPGQASTYSYDAGGERVQAATPAGTFDYFYGLGGALRGVWDASTSSWVRLDIGVGGMPLESWNANPPSGYSNYTYTSTSLLGSFAFRYNPSAGAMNYHYLPSGLEWPGEAQDATTNLHWGGHELDADSGLYHFLFRNYAPLEKRWLSPDPAGWAVGSPADPQSWDRYSYAEGSPCSTIDPTGLKKCPPNFKPLTARQAARVIAAAKRIANEPGWKYGENAKLETGIQGTLTHPTEIDCTHFIQIAIEEAGLYVPYQTTSEIASAREKYYLPAAAPAPGDVLLLDASANHNDPLSHAMLYAKSHDYFASNSSTGPTEVKPGVKSGESQNKFWGNRIAGGHYFIPCVGPLPQSGQIAAGGGGPALPGPFGWWTDPSEVILQMIDSEGTVWIDPEGLPGQWVWNPHGGYTY